MASGPDRSAGGPCLDADGARVDDADELVAPAAETVELAVAWAVEEDADVSLAEAIDASGARDATDVDPEVLQTFLASHITTEFGASADELSARWGLEEGTDGDDLFVLGGYDTLVASVVDELEVRLDHPVAGIDWDDGGVTVVGADGGVLDADRVIVTLPLGVLQAGAVTFDPPLPAGHQRAIDTPGMGLLDKVWLRFDEAFWAEEALACLRVAPAEEPFSEWFNLEPLTSQPVLLGLVGGPLARTWATRSDEDVEQAALASLGSFLDAGW